MNNTPLTSYSSFLHGHLVDRLETVNRDRNMATIRRLETAVQVCTDSITDLFRLITSDNFFSLEEEIHFFKVIKPLFAVEREYYQRLYHFELFGGQSAKYRQLELLRMDKLLGDHREFSSYYHMKMTENDAAWFSQGQMPLPTLLCIWPAETNERFMSARDGWVAGLLAVERYRKWLLEENERPGKL